MKKNVILIIQFILIVSLFSYSVYASQKTTIDASDIAYNGITVKQELDSLYNETNVLVQNGTAVQSDVYKDKTGYGKGQFIRGTMNDYTDSTIIVDNISRLDNDYVVFNIEDTGYYSNDTIFNMTFGNKYQFNIKEEGYLDKTTRIKVPSNKVHMYVGVPNTNGTSKDKNGNAITSTNKEEVEYGKTSTFKTTPNIGYYLSKIECTNGYTVSGFETGSTYISEQTVTVTNPNTVKDTECTVTNSPRSFTVNFNGNNGTVSPTNKTVIYDSTFGDLPTPTRTGYKFLGWFSAASGGTEYKSTTKVNITDTLNLYAHWEVITYTISYTLNSGSITGQKTSYTIETATFSLPTPTRTGYTFDGWTGSNGTTKQKSVSVAKGSTGNKTYTANWTATTYTISYTLNSGSISGQKTSYTIETASFTLPTPTRTGYTFTGWTGTGLSSATKSVTVAKGNYGNRSYTANWSINSYTVTVLGSNVSVSSTSFSLNYLASTTFTVTPNSGYYLNSISCTNSYTVSGFTTGTSATGKQTVTVKGGSATGSTCTISALSTCAYAINKNWNYSYTGGSQTFTVPCAGTYKLEVWGAQGGRNGGAGGYSYGTVTLSKSANIYIVVGGAGGLNSGGYNGGGAGQYLAGSVSPAGGGGGGATHMAKNNRGVLSNFASYKTDIYLVAGGGGGGSEYGYAGGAGGGTSGGQGSGGCYLSTGGTQTAPGARGDSDAGEAGFGFGGDAPYGKDKGGTYGAGGGGGGYYGGGAGSFSSGSDCAAGGSGGSGYIGGVTSGSTTAGQRSGDGYARVTLTSIS